MEYAKGHKNKKKRYTLLYLAMPFMIFVLLFYYVPILGWYLGFIEYSPGVDIFKAEFVGFKYFLLFFKDTADMLRTLKNTGIFAGASVLTIVAMPMIFAVFLNEVYHKKYARIIQTAATIPHLISWVIIYSFAFSIFSSDGVLNQVLIGLGLVSEPTNVLGNANAVYWFQSVINVWKEMGWGAIIYLASIAGIPGEQYEAAYIDGANKFQTAIYITIPGVMETFIVLLVLQIGNFVNIGFDQYFVFNNPAVQGNIEVLDLYVYRLGLVNHDYSYSTAIGVIKSAISIIMLFGANRLAKKIRGTNII